MVTYIKVFSKNLFCYSRSCLMYCQGRVEWPLYIEIFSPSEPSSSSENGYKTQFYCQNERKWADMRKHSVKSHVMLNKTLMYLWTLDWFSECPIKTVSVLSNGSFIILTSSEVRNIIIETENSYLQLRWSPERYRLGYEGESSCRRWDKCRMPWHFSY